MDLFVFFMSNLQLLAFGGLKCSYCSLINVDIFDLLFEKSYFSTCFNLSFSVLSSHLVMGHYPKLNSSP